ncbi:MAG: cation:proton antiporter [Candidatus Levybacteria bacterium]|nr:cation:proton antiporter [Candidatus Levybacteria bacterium]
MESVFFEIAIIIIISAVLSIIFRYLKQPAILAYILTGIILGPLGFFHLQHTGALQSFGQLGITLLLFMLGLELKLHELRSIGKTAIIAGSLQMGATLVLGYMLGILLGFPSAVCLYLSIALSFSSTIVIVKLLSDRKDLNSLHGKLAIGILLMQDFFAILTIIFMNGFHAGSIVEMTDQVLLVGLKLSVLIGWILLFSKYVFPRILHNLSKSGEILFLFSLAWVFAVTALVTWEPIGFSIEIGGFLAGLALANTHENYQIIARMKALRDFFVTIFFVILGIQMSLSNVVSSLLPAAILSAFVIFIKPFIVMIITGVLGFRKRTSFLVGTSLAQISEFSLIILFLGQSMGILPESIVTTVILVSIITFVVSTYIIQNSNQLYAIVGSRFGFLEFRKTPNKHDFVQSDEFKDYDKHVVLIGGHQMGQSIIHALKQSDEKVIVVDFDPDVINRLKDKKIPAIFGDIADPEIQDRIGFDRVKMVISTVPDLEDNLLLIEGLKHANRKAKVVVMAFESDEAKQLYKSGADYVVLPHLVGGDHLAKILINDDSLEMIEKYKAKDLAFLK